MIKPTTIRRTSFCLTKEMERQLNELKETLGENTSQVIMRAINLMYMMQKDK